MVSVADAVQQTVKADARVYEALKIGITNNRRLAKHIHAEVNTLTGHNASIATITVTLQRLAAKIQESEDTKYKNIFGKSRLQLRDDITILYIRGSPSIQKPEGDDTGFYVKIQGIGTTTLLLDDEALAETEYKNEDLLKKITNLSAIIITSPKDILDTPGVIAHLMMALGASRVNVVEVTSSYDSTFLIVDKMDSLKAVQAVRNLIKNSRK